MEESRKGKQAVICFSLTISCSLLTYARTHTHTHLHNVQNNPQVNYAFKDLMPFIFFMIDHLFC